MAQADSANEASLVDAPMTFVERVKDWATSEGPWWLCSFVFHLVLICSLALFTATVGANIVGDAPTFEASEDVPDKPLPEPELERFEVGDAPEDPTELNTDTLTLSEPGQIEQTEQINDDNPVFTERGGGVAVSITGPSLGGLGGFDFKASGPGPAVRGAGGVGVGTGNSPGSGGDGYGFGGRGTGMRKAMVGRFGGTKQSERAVAGALNWLARHQLPDGHWSIAGYKSCCKDGTCAGPGNVEADTAATAMALLPFLAAGQTHQSKGPYRAAIGNGLYWLMRAQKPDGDLRGNAKGNAGMYAHGLAAITLCEAYGLSGDKAVGAVAQRSLDFVMKAQNRGTGGWRYQPGEDGDTSVVGWQLMALKSGMMAGLRVDPYALDGVRKWLKSCAFGQHGGRFYYQPGDKDSPAMTAVGLLCLQYLGAGRCDPALMEGAAFLMAHQPDNNDRNLYYWYYATQVMHNMSGPDWDIWNRKMRHVLIDSQNKERDVCATGSWDPAKPAKDQWGEAGGRLMMTSLAVLTLEVYYRYLPLYKLDIEKDLKPVPPPEGEPAGKAKDTEKGKEPDKKKEKSAASEKAKKEKDKKNAGGEKQKKGDSKTKEPSPAEESAEE